MACKPYVTAVPHVTAEDLSPADAFVIIASDGVWDHLSYADAVTTVAQHVQAGRDRRAAAMALLAASAARAAGKPTATIDNATALVLFFS